MARKTSQKNNAIIVDGNDDLMVRMGKCCNPIPGDMISGHITRGRGITVHREDCQRLAHVESTRTINVNWNPEYFFKHPVGVRVMTNDRPGVLSTISTVINEAGINIRSAIATSLPDAKGSFIFSNRSTRLFRISQGHFGHRERFGGHFRQQGLNDEITFSFPSHRLGLSLFDSRDHRSVSPHLSHHALSFDHGLSLFKGPSPFLFLAALPSRLGAIPQGVEKTRSYSPSGQSDGGLGLSSASIFLWFRPISLSGKLITYAIFAAVIAFVLSRPQERHSPHSKGAKRPGP